MSTAADTPDAEGTARARGPQDGLGRVASRSWGYRVADVDALLLPLLDMYVCIGVFGSH